MRTQLTCRRPSSRGKVRRRGATWRRLFASRQVGGACCWRAVLSTTAGPLFGPPNTFTCPGRRPNAGRFAMRRWARPGWLIDPAATPQPQPHGGAGGASHRGVALAASAISAGDRVAAVDAGFHGACSLGALPAEPFVPHRHSDRRSHPPLRTRRTWVADSRRRQEVGQHTHRRGNPGDPLPQIGPRWWCYQKSQRGGPRQHEGVPFELVHPILSARQIRLLCQGPIVDVAGTVAGRLHDPGTRSACRELSYVISGRICGRVGHDKPAGPAPVCPATGEVVWRSRRLAGLLLPVIFPAYFLLLSRVRGAPAGLNRFDPQQRNG
jgi:hypothetical protein